jgi:hypothetical protein
MLFSLLHLWLRVLQTPTRARRTVGARALPAFESLEERCVPALFTVTTTADSGPGSLRQAILDANASRGLDIIRFAIDSGVRSITPVAPLPAITDPVILDGTTQPGYAGSPIIQLNGALAGDANGLDITGGGSTVRGLVINQFARNGALLEGNGSNTIDNNYIGTDVSGTIALGNGGAGVAVLSSHNFIGGPNPGTGNLIAGNLEDGVAISGIAASGNFVLANRIGLDGYGSTALGNGRYGILVDRAGGAQIGLQGAGLGNVISGNRGDGVHVVNSAPAPQVVGDLIGTDATGGAALGNGGAGLVVEGGGALIGAPLAGGGNVISGNAGDGVRLAGTVTDLTLVLGDLIGLNAAGTAAVGNGGTGLAVEGGGAIVGSNGVRARNVISGNVGDGVRLEGTIPTTSSLFNNYIGTDASGVLGLGNGGAGVFVASRGALVGGVSADARNVIAANAGDGIHIQGFSTMNVQVVGNYIGVDAGGAAPLGNGRNGVFLDDAASTQVGLASPESANVIGGNRKAGVAIAGRNAWQNLVLGNAIGTDLTGTTPLGNGGDGVLVEDGASRNQIGGTFDGAGNRIAFNGRAGVKVGKGGSDSCLGNAIRANAIYADSRHGIAVKNPCISPPVLTAAEPGAVTHVVGTVHGATFAVVYLDFFANGAEGSPSQTRFLEARSVTADEHGNAGFDLLLNVPTRAGETLTATATDILSNTSALAAAIPLDSPGGFGTGVILPATPSAGAVGRPSLAVRTALPGRPTEESLAAPANASRRLPSFRRELVHCGLRVRAPRLEDDRGEIRVID